MTCIADRLTKKAEATNTATLVGAGLGAGAGYGLGSAFDLSTTGKILAALGGGVAGGTAGHAVGKDYDQYKDKTGTGLPWAEANKGKLYTAGGAVAGAGLGYLTNRVVGRNKDAVSALGSIIAGGGLGALAGNLYHSGVLSEGEKRLVDEAAASGIKFGSKEWEEKKLEIQNEESNKDVNLFDKMLKNLTWGKAFGYGGAGGAAALEGVRVVGKSRDFEAFKKAMAEVFPAGLSGHTPAQVQEMFLAQRGATRAQMTWPQKVGYAASSVLPWRRSPYRGVTAAELRANAKIVNSVALNVKPGFWPALFRMLRVTL